MKDKMDDAGDNGDDENDGNEYDGQRLHRYPDIDLSKDIFVVDGSAAESST
jgi:hypothetical protein